jgi:hypothetical protein
VYDLDKIRKKYGLDVSPTTVVLLQELERFNRLISTMFRSLSTLRRVTLMKNCLNLNNNIKFIFEFYRH